MWAIEGKTHLFSVNLHPLRRHTIGIHGFFITCLYFFSSYMLLVRGRGVQKEGGWQFLTNSLSQPRQVSDGFCVRSHVRTRVRVCVCMHVCTVCGRGRVDWRSTKGVVLGYTIQQTGTYWIYSVRSSSQEPDLQHVFPCTLALVRDRAQTCVIIYVHLYVGEANTCVYIPVFVSSTHTLPKSRRSN